MKVKGTERMEFCIKIEGWYFEKALTKKTDYEAEDSDK